MNDERTDGVQRGWYDLGKYRVLATGLHLNPYFTTHHIYLAGKLIGRQLSVPTADDCRWYEKSGGTYARPDQNFKVIFGYTNQHRSRRGRPSNAERARREAYLRDADEVLA